MYLSFNILELTNVKTYGEKRSSKIVDDNVSDADRDTA